MVNYTFKLLYAVSMIIIISGHLDNGGVNLLYDWFPPYAFHVCAFMFASGYFYRDEAQKNVLKYITKKIKSLIIPLYLWNCFYALLVWGLSFAGFTIGGEVTLKKLIFQPILDGHQFEYNSPGWFVIPLFMTQITVAVVRKLLESAFGHIREGIYFTLGMLVGITGVIMASCGLNMGVWLPIVRMMYFVPFFGLGIFYRKVLEKWDTIGSFWYFAILFALELIIILIWQKTPDYSQCWCSNFIDGPILPFVVGFIGIAFWLRVCRILEPCIGRSKYINLIADNTFLIMIHQFTAFMVVKAVFALISIMTPLCADFDMVAFKSDIWYFYLPRGVQQAKIIYMAAALVLPVLLGRLVGAMRNRMAVILQR